MTAAVDTFHSFVDTLVDVLDDHEATGDELALRLHFSRFHFDRMIKSVAGEPPSAFRRRILLERAAYRMITTRAPLIDIAVEAGYGSHEAFTRAFKQAYGATPAAWRKKPGHIQIEAPSDVHFQPPGSIRLPARDKVTPMELLTKMVEHHIWLTGEMVRLAERLTDEQLDAAIGLDVDEDEQTIRSLLSRLIGQMGMWNAAMATRDYDWSVEEHESLSSMRERLAVEGPTYLAHVRDVTENGRVDDTFVDALCEPAEVFTYGGMIAHVLTFAAHRRTLVVLAFAKHGARGARLGRPHALGRRARLTSVGPIASGRRQREMLARNRRRIGVAAPTRWRRGDRGPARGHGRVGAGVHRPGRPYRLPGAAAADRGRRRGRRTSPGSRRSTSSPTWCCSGCCRRCCTPRPSRPRSSTSTPTGARSCCCRSAWWCSRPWAWASSCTP